MAGVRAVFFDVAGTLLHPAEPVGTTYARILVAHGIPIHPEAAQSAFLEVWRERPGPWVSRAVADGGRRSGTDAPGGADGDDREKSWWRETVAEVIRRCGAPEAAVGTGFAAAFEEIFACFGRGSAWVLFPEVRSVLDRFRAAGHRLFVLSNFDRRLHGVLRDLGIRDRFEGIVISAEAGAAKPDAAIFAVAAAAAGLAPDECLHVGDDPVADWAGAESAGFRVWRLDRSEGTLDALAAALTAP